MQPLARFLRPAAASAIPLLIIGLAGGCITHEVRARHRAQIPEGQPVVMPIASALVEHTYHHRWNGRALRSDPLPVDMAISVWSYAPDGKLRRSDRLIVSPRPWWQRFPADFITDLLVPDTLYAVRLEVIEPTPQRPISREKLEREAAVAGFGDPDLPDPATNQERP